MTEPLVVRDPSMRPAGELLRGPAVHCSPEASVRDAAQAMTAAGRRHVLVRLGDGEWGIFTDGDLRRRVVAAGLDTTVPVRTVSTAPARTVPADRLGADVLMDMLAHGVRHMPVLSAAGEPLGVLEDTDLLATATRGGFVLRRAIAQASDPDALVAAAARVPELVVGLWRARVAALDVSAILSVLVDAAVAGAARMVRDDRPGGAAWLTLGSVARREAMPGSDVDSAMVWPDTADGPEARQAALGYARRVHELLARCGFRADEKGALASRPRFARPESGWRTALDGWLADPYADQGVVMISLLADSRIATGPGDLDLAAAARRRLRATPDARRLLLREAVEDKARMHSLRQILTRRTDAVDLKAQGVMPVVNIARWAGLAAESAVTATPARLRAAAAAGLLSEDDATSLAESFDVLAQIRLRHQCEQIERGERPTDVVAISALTPLYRSLLANAIREIAGVQRTLAYAGPPS
ncbi:putative nucleotidyltransferase substrate binding domain-containing protein [Rhodococcus sp. NPDC127528]|uniref:putative nucleotidyltransferase substrate binding domain-containing protein n=1 Tax=unclassified Rhodococcus (in: high G+C Gram-positive bacteria) TaxID=192944 RepID=UPI00362AA4E9